jgi:hypothetical protein
MASVVVEYQFESDPGDGAWRKLSTCLAVREIRPVVAYCSRDRTRQVRVYEAADAENVRQAHRAADVAFRSCWTADSSP